MEAILVFKNFITLSNEFRVFKSPNIFQLAIKYIYLFGFFMVLPFGVRNQIDSPDFQKGTDPRFKKFNCEPPIIYTWSELF